MQGYPYDTKLSRKEYEHTLRLLQIELLKLQAHVKDAGQKIAILFEGRDVGVPDPLLVGPADRVHEDDEDPARFFPSTDSLGRAAPR